MICYYLCITTYFRDSRNNRLNKAKQLQKSKRGEIWLQQRIGASDGPPKVVGIVPLSADTNVLSVLQECLREASWSDGRPETSHHIVNALYLKYKARCSYVVADNSLSSALDVVRVADILVLVVDGGQSQEFVIDQVNTTPTHCSSTERVNVVISVMIFFAMLCYAMLIYHITLS
jgi:hypothetical protein